METTRTNALYGSTFECTCGKTHRIEPHMVCYEEGALAHLPQVVQRCTSGRRLAVVMDTRTADVIGMAAGATFPDGDWHVTNIVVPDPATDASPVCDDRTHVGLLSRIPHVDVLLAVGSGVISDLAKWAATDLGIPYVSVATAASMNGYASANVAATIKGIKTLLRGRPPYAVISDPVLLCNAPYELTAAGLGDALAKSVSSADWRMNHLLFDDYYCERSVTLIADIEPLYRDNPESVQARQRTAIGGLFEALLLTGVAMNMAETSAPASGGEHLISHTLDMMSSLDGIAHDLHGRQVGVGTILASELYRQVLSTESPNFTTDPGDIDHDFWGHLSEEVKNHYLQKHERLRTAAHILSRGNMWDRVREALVPLLRTPEELRDCLRRAGAAYQSEHIGCSPERLLAALLHAHQIRSRFTILDLARLTGMLPRKAGTLIEEWG
jgi:glycerol-1-phosphate dehydrogenase [NAD(P)+]